MSDKSNLPLWKHEDVAVWEKNTPNGTKLFSISEGPRGGAKTYTTVFSKVGSSELTPEQAGRLYLGEDVVVQMNGPKGEYEAIFAARGIKEDQRTGVNGQVFVNHTLDLGMALPMHRKEGGTLCGFKVDGATYFQTVGPEENPITLTAGNAIRLAANKPVEKDGFVLTLGEIRDNERGRTARVNIVPVEAATADLDMPGLGEDGPDMGEVEPDMSGMSGMNDMGPSMTEEPEGYSARA